MSRDAGTVTLTEEEIVAVAAILDITWPTTFQLLSPVDGPEVARVIERGGRTLAVRGLIEMGADGPQLGRTLSRITAAFEPETHLAVYGADAELPGEPTAPIVYLHPGHGAEMLVETESGMGTRTLALVDSEQMVERVRVAARSVFDGHGTEALHIARIAGGRADVTTVTSGRLVDFAVAPGTTTNLGFTSFWDDTRITGLFGRVAATS